MRKQLSFIGNSELDAVRTDARFCAEHGFEGLEFNYWGNFEQLERSTVEQMSAVLDEHGVKCVMLGIWGWNHLALDSAERDKAHTMLQKAVEFGQLLKAEVLTTGGGLIGEDLRANVSEFAKVFPPLLDAIQAGGMVPAIYPLHGNSFFSGIEAYERVWETFPEVGIKFDPANWRHQGLDYLRVLRAYGSKVAHLHIKEHLYHDGDMVSQPAAGMGDIEWGKVFAFLYEHNYEGPLSIEPHGPVWSKGVMRERMLLLTQRHIGPLLI